MKTGKTLKLAGALAASLALLTVLAGCGQSSKPSPKSETPSGTPAKSASRTSSSTQASSPPASSSSSSTPGSSFASASASNTPSSTGETSAPSSSGSSAVPWATSVIQNGSQSEDLLTDSATGIDYVLAYIKLEGGIGNINPSTFLVDYVLIGRQGSESEWNSNNVLPMYQAHVNLSTNEVTLTSYSGPAPKVNQEWIYNLEDLKSEYYSTPSQQEEVKNLLCQGEFNEIVDLAAYRKMWSMGAGQKDVLQFSASALSITGNMMANMGNSGSYMMLEGDQVKVITYPGMGAPPWTVSYSIESLLNQYYSTSYWRTTLNSYINTSTQSFSSMYAASEEAGNSSN